MADLFQNKYRIQTARAEWHGYDGGIYFVTICTAGREHYFGEIETGTEPIMYLSPIGSFANQLITNITTLYPYAEIPLFVIMPNHIHAIVYINRNSLKNNNLNTHNRVDAMNFGNNGDAMNFGNNGDAMNFGNNGDAMNRVSTGGVTGQRNPMITNCLGTVIRGLKARVTRWANQNSIPFGWQARFYDRVVRNHDELNRIADYIENNVINWHSDEMNIR